MFIVHVQNIILGDMTMENASKSTLKGKMLPLSMLAASCGMFNILYLCVIFYVPFQSAFGFTNAQMGGLLAVFAILATPGNFIGGLVCDMFNPKYMLVGACVVSASCGFALSTFPSYPVALVIYVILSIPCGVLAWSPYCKLVGMMGDNSEQGRLFGTCNTIDGILTCTLTLGLTAFFGNSIGTRPSFRIVILIMSSFYMMTGIGIALFYDYKKWSTINGVASKPEKFTLKSLVSVIKLPFTWIAVIMLMGSYMASSCFTYMSPYLNAVYILPVGLASAFGVITRYGVKVVASPIGGFIRDRKFGGSTSKLGWLATSVVCIFIVLLLLLPKNTAFMIPAVIIALCAIFGYRLNNTSESTIYRQLKSTPPQLMGTIIGFASMLGYSSDLWLPSAIGRILDTNGDAGYKYVFLILCGSLVMMSFGGVALYILFKREQQGGNILTEAGTQI